MLCLITAEGAKGAPEKYKGAILPRPHRPPSCMVNCGPADQPPIATTMQHVGISFAKYQPILVHAFVYSRTHAIISLSHGLPYLMGPRCEAEVVGYFARELPEREIAQVTPERTDLEHQRCHY
jgi:hypothetical protein